MPNLDERISASSLLRLISFATLAAFAAFGAEPAKETRPNLPRVTAITQITDDGISKANLLSDSSDLYVTEASATGHIVAKLSLPNAERKVIPAAFPNVQALDISPDHSKLLVSHQDVGGENEFWIVPVGAGEPHRLGDLTGRDAAWSNDGRHLAFAKGSTLFITNADGTGVHEVFSANGSVFGLRFSPDGKRIRFTVGNTTQSTTALWEIGRDGSNPHPILHNWQYATSACCGHWTANGLYYIFQVTQTNPSNMTTLWALADSGASAKTVPRQLTTGPISFGNASPATDNKRLWALGVQPTGEAVKFDSSKKTFVPLLSGVSATDLDYSADGTWVAYISVPDGTLWRCKADGTEKLQLTSPPERAALPRWSPSGDRIAYVSLKPEQPSQIAVVPVNGGDPQLPLPEARGQIDANWSPDGTRIMFGYLHSAEDLNFKVVDLATHQTEILPGSEQLFSPRWSPNGRYVAALSPDYTKVMLFDHQTKKWSVWLSESAGAVSYPIWSADSKSLYFDDLVTDEESIRRVKIGSNHAEKVFKLEGIERYPGPFGLWSGRTADGSWMFVRDRSTQEVYQLTLELP
jgi:Tol biopolymer transport system component